MRKKAARVSVASRAVESPPTPTRGGGLLIAVELGGEWPGLMASDASARRVLTQLDGEAPTAFAERVAQGLDAAFGLGIELGTLALACNERLDPAADSARRSLVALALGAMAQRHAGKVYLTASPRSSGRLRHYLSALAQASLEEWQSAGLEVSVDFGREAPETVTGSVLRARVA